MTVVQVIRSALEEGRPSERVVFKKRKDGKIVALFFQEDDPDRLVFEVVLTDDGRFYNEQADEYL
jgi:hypothetical protein